jgi:transcription elongation factor GreB
VSRAFVKEGDGPEIVFRPEPALPPGTPNLVTPEGARTFRRRVSTLAAERAGLGDSGVDEARRRALDEELRWLEQRLATFVVTPPHPAPERVSFGTVVTLEGDTTRTVRIVGVDESDPAQGSVSWVSPLGRALLGSSPGDTVVVPTPRGDEEWEVVSVSAP